MVLAGACCHLLVVVVRAHDVVGTVCGRSLRVVVGHLLISVHLFCPRKFEESKYFSEICEYSYISHHTHSQWLYMKFQTFRHPSHRFSTCMPTISEYFITCPCTISTPFRIFNAIPIRHTNIYRTFRNISLDTKSVNPTAFVML